MYDALSEDYDRFVNWPSRLAFEMPFIDRQLLMVAGAGHLRVLDTACGTGMHAIALAQRGHFSYGADLSSSMIEKARFNATIANANTHFEVAGFGDLEKTFNSTRDFPFDVLLCLGNSLPHLLKLSDLSASLRDFAACLRPGGLLIIQNRNFDAVMMKRSRWMEPQVFREGEQEWLFMRFYDFEPDGLINFNIITLKREGSGNWDQRATATHLYPLRSHELIGALKNSGFDRITCYGGMDGSPYDPDNSGNLITVASLIVP